MGATQPEQIRDIRALSGSMPLLIPGVGAQGGSLEKAVSYGTDSFTKTAVINVSRSVLFASQGDDFCERARSELIKLNDIVEALRREGEPNHQGSDEHKPEESTAREDALPESDEQATAQSDVVSGNREND